MVDSGKVERFGDVRVPNGKLHDVLYIPQLKSNLLLVAKLCQDYKVEFHKDMCYVIDPNTNQVVVNAKLDHDNSFKFMSLPLEGTLCKQIMVLMCGIKGLVI